MQLITWNVQWFCGLDDVVSVERIVDEARAMAAAVKKAGVIHMVAFNYRRTPAVALAKKYIGKYARRKAEA